MTIYKCDRCGQATAVAPADPRLYTFAVRAGPLPREGAESFALCQGCWDELQKWLKPPSKSWSDERKIEILRICDELRTTGRAYAKAKLELDSLSDDEIAELHRVLLELQEEHAGGTGVGG
jgi:hypothetical protein